MPEGGSGGNGPTLDLDATVQYTDGCLRSHNLAPVHPRRPTLQVRFKPRSQLLQPSAPRPNLDADHNIRLTCGTPRVREPALTLACS